MDKTVFFICTKFFGIYKSRACQIKYFLKRGYSVTVLANYDEYKEKLEKLGVETIEIPITSYNPISALKTLIRLNRSFLSKKPECLIVYNSFPILLSILAIWKRNFHSIFVFTGRGYLFENGYLMKTISRWIYNVRLPRKNIKIITQNFDDLRFLSDNLNRDIQLIESSGVDTKYFTSDFKKESKKIRILCMSRIQPDKGILEYLSAVMKISIKNPSQYEFILAGGINRNKLNKKFLKDFDDKLNESKVNFIGYRNDVKSLLNTIDIFVYPSYHEGAPRTCLEAASMSLPIITTDTRGCRLTVLDGKTGYLIPPKDDETLAEKMLILMNNKNLRKEMGEHARIFIESKFSMSVINDQYFKIFDNLIKNE